MLIVMDKDPTEASNNFDYFGIKGQRLYHGNHGPATPWRSQYTLYNKSAYTTDLMRVERVNRNSEVAGRKPKQKSWKTLKCCVEWQGTLQDSSL